MKKLLLIIVVLVTFTGCSNREYDSSINVLNWSSYIPDYVIRDFEEKYSIKVNYSTYSSNEELLAKVSGVRKGTYDLVFPSDYMVEIMKDKGIIQKLDKNRINNYNFIEDRYLGLDYDSNNEYSIPFLASSVVIAVNREMIPDEISSYNDLLRKNYKNSIVLIDDTRIVIGSALMALGYDINSINDSELNEAMDWLIRLKPNVKAMDSDSPKSFLISKEANIGLMWSAEALLAKSVNNNIEIIVPNEESIVSIDNFAIMNGSEKLDEVYLFIDYILSSDVMEKIISDYPYFSVNKETSKNFGINYVMGNEYNRLQDFIVNNNRIRNIGQTIVKYDKIWASIK